MRMTADEVMERRRLFWDARRRAIQVLADAEGRRLDLAEDDLRRTEAAIERWSDLVREHTRLDWEALIRTLEDTGRHDLLRAVTGSGEISECDQKKQGSEEPRDG